MKAKAKPFFISDDVDARKEQLYRYFNHRQMVLAADEADWITKAFAGMNPTEKTLNARIDLEGWGGRLMNYAELEYAEQHPNEIQTDGSVD